jgi:nicotinamide-nucleotide amidase
VSAPPPADPELHALAIAALAALAQRGWRVALAESCTGGWIAKALTDIAGSSAQFEAGYVTYANHAKVAALGVRSATLATEGAVSRAAVLEMAAGVGARSGAELGLSVSGIAGPGGGSAGKPVGLVWFGWQTAAGHDAGHCQFDGDRDSVRRQAVAHALRLVATLAAGHG